MKIKQLQKHMRAKDLDLALFFTNETKKDFNVNYFSQAACQIAYLTIPKKGNAVLFVSVLEYGDISADVKIEPLDKKLGEKLKQKYKTIKKIGINYDTVSINELKASKKAFPGSKFTDISSICKELRETKTEEEIKIIKKACSITDRILQDCISNFNLFLTEEEVVEFLAQETRKAGCVFSFNPVVASGAGAAVPHYKSGGNLKNGFCIIDYGIIYKGYCSDITRTLYLGKPSGQEICIYKTLLDTQKSAISSLKPGKPIKEIDCEMRKTLGSYSKYFIHTPGHGIGTEIHEKPFLSGDSKARLKENSVFTIEPGIYMPGKLGIRIEDDVVLTEKGAIILTKTKKDLICITHRKRK